jgi:1-acyl-sn-glycerol-3-phosphate acyltransferase
MTSGDHTLTRYRGPASARGALGAITRLREQLRHRADAAVDTLLGDEVRARLARLSVQRGESGVDPFGFDPQVARYGVLVARAIYRSYFRTQVHGIENVPAGRVMLIANHSGQLPLDAVAIAAAMLLEADPPRFVRSMVEKWTATLPFVSEFFARCGQIVGVPENCIRLLEMDEAVLVFPEGARGISKTFDERYRLTDFGLGFMRMALQTQTPIVPVAVIGAEEQYVSVANLRRVARLLGMPALPVMPQLLLPGGFLPLPTRYRIYFGEPLVFPGDPDDEDAVIEEKVWVVKSTVQSMINRGLKERKSIFF